MQFLLQLPVAGLYTQDGTNSTLTALNNFSCYIKNKLIVLLGLFLRFACTHLFVELALFFDIFD